MRFLITGTAGFIGFFVAKSLLESGHEVYGYDGMTNYYSLKLKQARLDILKPFSRYTHVEAMLEDYDSLYNLAKLAKPEIIIHLAAQAGVRYSLENPRDYVNSNLVGSFNILEIAREFKPQHLILASTSSIYGNNEKIPFEEGDKADEPLTLYAASKKSMELMAHSYAHLWKIPTTALRFFTVYGPLGRPDMALFKFVDSARSGKPIDIYGTGEQKRDFTYIDDLVEAIIRLIPLSPDKILSELTIDNLSQQGPFRIVNLGGGRPVSLLSFIEALEAALEQDLSRQHLPHQNGDALNTYASPQLLKLLTGFTPAIDINQGIKSFIKWYRSYMEKSHDSL